MKLVKNNSNRCLDQESETSITFGNRVRTRSGGSSGMLRNLDATDRMDPTGGSSKISKGLGSKTKLKVLGSSKMLKGLGSKNKLTSSKHNFSQLSYPELFEGDISTSMFNTTVVAPMEGGLTLKIDEKKKKNISEKFLSNWFFKQQTKEADDEFHSETSSICSAVEDQKKTSISSLVSKHFTAAGDFRQLNFSVPQSM